MPPYSTPLPITRALANYCYTPKSLRSRSLQAGESTPLACYQKQPIDPYLKEVAHLVKEPLALFSKIIVHSVVSVKINSEHGVEEVRWELTVKRAHTSLCNVKDALVFLHKGYFDSKALLKHVEQIPHPKKLSEKEVHKLTKLKENLLKLNKFLDCILLHYSSFSWGSLPTIKEIKSAAKKVFKAINNLKPDRLQNLVHDSITEEDVLCSVLGLQIDLANRLKNMNKDMRQHKTDMYYLMCFIKECDESRNVVNLHDTEAVQRGLQKMGFTENRSNVVAKWIGEQPFPQHKSLLAWAHIYIENLFKYDVFLNDQVCKFPYKETNLNRWFDVQVERGAGENGRVPQVPVINTTTKEEAEARVKEKIRLRPTNDNGRLYFHGTDHKSAQSILENGINLRDGGKCCDFSHGKGFYVADNYQYALEYAHSKTKAAAAVILFDIRDDYLRGLRGLDLSGPGDRDDLKSVVKFFSSGEQRKHRPDQGLYNEIGNCHYITGPISRDGVSRGNRWHSVNQICIRNEEMAEEVGNPVHMVGIVFLNTENA